MDTGKFHKSIKAKTKNNELEILSKDSKSDMLESEFGNIFGINEDQMESLTKRIKNHLYEDLRKYFK